MTDANDLLDAVDQLTQPVRRKVMQEEKLATVELPPLLNQLEQAIRGSIGIGGSGSLAHQRNMLDADALYKFTIITTLINDWARGVKAAVDLRDPATTLRRWYIKYSSTPRALESERFYVKKMLSWVHSIEAKLDPPNMADLPHACPICGADSWWNPADRLEYLRPLVIEYRPDDVELVKKAKCYCRACENVWGVRELVVLLDLPEQTLTDGVA